MPRLSGFSFERDFAVMSYGPYVAKSSRNISVYFLSVRMKQSDWLRSLSERAGVFLLDCIKPKDLVILSTMYTRIDNILREMRLKVGKFI
jgi:hypothetical protein